MLIPPRGNQGIRRHKTGQCVVPAILVCLALTGCGGPDKPVGSVGHIEGFAGLVAADEPRAVSVGRDVLSAGGNATDAAVAMAFTLTATLPSQAGLGGGGTCLVYNQPAKKVEVLDFLSPPPAATGPKTIRPSAIPTLPRGLFALHSKYGRLRWEQLMAPAETYARLGIPASRAFTQQLAPIAPALFDDRSCAFLRKPLTRRFLVSPAPWG